MANDNHNFTKKCDCESSQ